MELTLRRRKPQPSVVPTYKNGVIPSHPTIRERASEMVDWVTSLRGSGIRNFSRTFWPSKPSYAGTEINRNAARSLYRNGERHADLGSGFCRPIVDGIVEYAGLPHASTQDELIDEFLNFAIHDVWAGKIQEAWRNALRESSVVVRYRRPAVFNPLIAVDELRAGHLEIYDRERVDLYPSATDPDWIEQAFVIHEEVRVIEPASLNGRAFQHPQVRTETLIEWITPTEIRWFNETTGEHLTARDEPNRFGFVPLLEVFNDYDSSLEGGQSEFEGPYPFIRAFHEVMADTLQAHKQHSIPKAVFNVNDVMAFIANNWPDEFEKDDSGEPILSSFSGKITFKGTELFFMQPDEKAGFIEARSALGDSTTLLDFILDCIAIASETPRSVLLKQKIQQTPDEMATWKKKIERKRNDFQQYLQMLLKMTMAANSIEVVLPKLEWDEINPQDAVNSAQALQMTTASGELLTQRRIISDRTLREHLRKQIPQMRSPEQEARDAESNVDLLAQSAPPNSAGRETATGSRAGGGQNE